MTEENKKEIDYEYLKARINADNVSEDSIYQFLKDNLGEFDVKPALKAAENIRKMATTNDNIHTILKKDLEYLENKNKDYIEKLGNAVADLERVERKIREIKRGIQYNDDYIVYSAEKLENFEKACLLLQEKFRAQKL